MFSTSEKVLTLRHRHGLTMEEAAAKAGISPVTYRGRERGETSWKLDELKALAEAFGVSVHDLIDDPPETMQ
jgi:transcriptional regulator with XRE-family HTH domain